jgi:Trk K+ transport system NAD-binding subunit
MANLATQPGVVEFFETLTKADSAEIAVEELTVSPASMLVGKTLMEAQSTLSSGAMIVALRKPSGLIPSTKLETRIEVDDTVIVLGAPEELAAFQQKNKGIH